MVISEAFELYRTDVILFKNQSSSTEENHLVCLKALVSYFGDIPVESITFSMVRDWKTALEKHRSDQTVKNYIVRFRVVLEFCASRGVPCLRASDVPVPKVGDTIPEFISKDDVSKLIKATSTPCHGYARMNRLRSAATIAMLYASGIRVSELCGLNRSDIQEDGTFTVIGKGKKARLCFLDQRAIWLLDEYLAARTDSDPALFICAKTATVSPQATYKQYFAWRVKKQGSPSRYTLIPSGTPLPPIYSATTLIFVMYKPCLVMQVWKQPSVTHM